MSATLRKTIPHEVEIPLSGSDIADLFWEMNACSQAEFFNHLCGKDRLVFQLQAITDSASLNDKGRMAMALIGDYAYSDKQLQPV